MYLLFIMKQLARLFVLLVFTMNTHAEPLYLGTDIPFQYYEDKEGALSLEQFQKIPVPDLKQASDIRSFGYTNSAFWVRFTLPEHLFLGQDRWIQLEPNYLDHLTFYYNEVGANGTWNKREAGDLSSTPRGDIDYRFPVFILPAQPTSSAHNAGGYDIVIRVKSSSAVVLNASLWSPEEFSQQAAITSSFWSFYSGLVLLSSALALLLALLLRRRLFWSIFLFSLTSILVLCIEGYIAWIWGEIGLRVQHYLTSILSLLGYTSLLWMSMEACDMKKQFPLIYRLMTLIIVINLLMLASIPLDLYGSAVLAQGIILPIGTLIFSFAVFRIWKRGTFQPLALIAGLSPLVYLICAILALLCLYGLLPFERSIYLAWKFTLLVNLILVLWLATSKILKERKQAQEQALLEQELRLERQASLRQRQFIGLVSHEFRTPLSIISTTLQNLRLLPLDPQITTRYDKIQRSTDRLIQLTDNCLADARLDGAIGSLQLETMNLSALLIEIASAIEHSVHHQLQLSFDGHNLSTTECMPEIIIRADRAMLRIALSNLVDNAIKYAPSGPILIDINRSKKQVVVSIEDQGSGVPANQTSIIFERYQRLPEAVSSQCMGTGLGLFVARQIAQAHDGDLQLTTSSPLGCRFEVTLPI